MLEIKDVSIRFGSLTITDHVNFTLEEGQWLMIAGPNGAGKSTLIGAISQGVPYTGDILFEGKSLSAWKTAELARKMGVLTQNHNVGYSFTVEEVVRLGRYSHSKKFFSSRSGNDDEAFIEAALEDTGLTDLRHQSVLTLSGGELQRTFLAQILAQDPSLLILDEPTNHLDLIYQKQIFELIGKWLEKPGRAVISVVHDLSLAKAYGSHALLLNHGRTVALGRIDEVLSPGYLNPVYGMDVAEWMQSMLEQWK